MSTDLTSEFTHFNLVIRLSKVQQLALPFCTFCEVPLLRLSLEILCAMHTSQSEAVLNIQKHPLFAAVYSDIASYHERGTRQAHDFQVWSLLFWLFGEVKHFVHLIRWNLKAILCQLGQELTTVPVQGIITRTLGFRNWILLVILVFLDSYDIRAMFPWTPPPTSWPTSAHPPTTSSPWPSNPPTMTTPTRPPMSWPPTMPTSLPLPPHGLPVEQSHYPVNHPPMHGATSPSVEHFFGHPSTLQLQPSLASTTSQPSTTHSTPTTFTTLATAAHNLPAHLFPPTSTTSSPDPSIVHATSPTLGTHVSQPTPPTWTTSHGPVSEQSISPTTSSPPVPPHQSPPLRVHRPKQTTSSPPTSSTPRLTAVKAAPKLRPDKKTDKSRRAPPPVPTTSTFEPASASPPSTSVQHNRILQHWAPPHNILPSPFDFYMPNNNNRSMSTDSPYRTWNNHKT